MRDCLVVPLLGTGKILLGLCEVEEFYFWMAF